MALVLDDTQLQASEPKKTSSDLGRIGQLMVRRTQDWVKSTVGKLSVLLKKIISCTSAHQHWKVRLELVELDDHLLSRCSQSLGECVGLLLEALVGAVNDEDPRVRERCAFIDILCSKKIRLLDTKTFNETFLLSCRCEVALREVSQRNRSCGSSSAQTFTDVLSENLHSLATSLPRLMRTSDDQKKLFVLNVFLGYIKVLGPLVSVVLNSGAHLERISRALMQVRLATIVSDHTSSSSFIGVCVLSLNKNPLQIFAHSFMTDTSKELLNQSSQNNSTTCLRIIFH